MPDSLVVVTMNQFRAGLLAREQRQQAEMVRRWLDVENALEAQIAALVDEARRLAGEGGTLRPRELFALARYRSLLAQLQIELRNYTDYASSLIEAQQQAYALLGIEHAATAISVSTTTGVTPRFDVLPIQAVENMVGLAGDGSPLRQLLEASWPEATHGLTQELIRSTALGVNPRETARRMVAGTSRSLDRMLNIARTEQLRVYREASRQTYQASRVVSGFRRIATRDSRVCAGCLAADGELYELADSLRSHPSCRCGMIPVVIGQPAATWTLGPVWFATQSAATQRQILGPGKYELWRSGRVAFTDFAAVRRNPVWGDAIVPATLEELAA